MKNKKPFVNNKELVYRALKDKAKSSQEISDIVGLSVSHINKILQYLREEGLTVIAGYLRKGGRLRCAIHKRSDSDEVVVSDEVKYKKRAEKYQAKKEAEREAPDDEPEVTINGNNVIRNNFPKRAIKKQIGHKLNEFDRIMNGLRDSGNFFLKGTDE